MNNNIIPLLYEYYFDDEKKVKSTIELAIKDCEYKVADTIGRVKIEKKEC